MFRKHNDIVIVTLSLHSVYITILILLKNLNTHKMKKIYFLSMVLLVTFTGFAQFTTTTYRGAFAPAPESAGGAHRGSCRRRRPARPAARPERAHRLDPLAAKPWLCADPARGWRSHC